MSIAARLLIVEDEPHIRAGLAKGLVKSAEAIDTAGDVNQALDLIDRFTYDVIIADVRLPGDRNGLELVQLVRERSPATAVIVITAHGSVDTAVDAMRRGAFDFITKPVELSLIRQQIAKAIDHERLVGENQTLKSRLADAGAISNIIGNCTIMRDLFAQLRQVADTDATVLIQGESGTGKELIARALHDLSSRRGGPFIAVNLGALPETLLESELFGYESGAFTGANRRKPGCFEQAVSGTLFLDEITEIPTKSQVDLLRVLETGQYTRLGGDQLLTSDARIVTATNRDPVELIRDGGFREDLYYRLNIVPLCVPPLRNRPDDIPLLIEHFLTHFCIRHRRAMKRMDDDAMQSLVRGRWPGNVRQLRNLIERLVVTLTHETITVQDLPADLWVSTNTGSQPLQTLAEATEAAERSAIQAALAACDFHRDRAAKRLGVSVRTLHYKMSRYGMH